MAEERAQRRLAAVVDQRQLAFEHIDEFVLMRMPVALARPIARRQAHGRRRARPGPDWGETRRWREQGIETERPLRRIGRKRKTEERWSRNPGDAVGTARELPPVEEHDADDLAEPERDDGL